MPLAALAGGLIGGSLLEALGRKATILFTAVPFMCAGLLVTYAQDVNMICAGRTITGFCIGIVSLSLPVQKNSRKCIIFLFKINTCMDYF